MTVYRIKMKNVRGYVNEVLRIIILTSFVFMYCLIVHKFLIINERLCKFEEGSLVSGSLSDSDCLFNILLFVDYLALKPLIRAHLDSP